MRGIRCALVAVMVAGIVTMVDAQQGRPRGGPGGGVDVATLVLTNTALQDDIKATAAQKEKFKPIGDKLTDLNKKRGELFGKGFKGADKEKMTELFEEGKKVNEEAKKVLDAELTTEQKNRIKQIGLQVMGVRAFSEPREGKGGFGGTSEADKATMKEVADALKLTDDQKTKVKGIVEEFNKDRAAVQKDVFGDTKGAFFNRDPEKQKEFNTKSDKLSAEAMGKITAVLDDAQKAAWKGLVGEAFDTSKLRPSFGARKD